MPWRAREVYNVILLLPPVLPERCCCANWTDPTKATADTALRELHSEGSHFFNKVGFTFKADTRQLRHDDVAIFNFNGVRETAIRLE